MSEAPKTDVASSLVDAGVTASVIYQEIESHIHAGFCLYNAGDEWVKDVQVSGLFYEFPPHTKVEVRPRYRHQRGGKFKTQVLLNAPLVLDDRGEPVAVAANILLRVAHRGVCLVYSSKEQPLSPRDREIVAQARERYLKYRVVRARDVQAGWLTKCKAASESGGLPPSQPAYVRDEIAFLRDHEMGIVGGMQRRGKFIVLVDGRDFDTMPEAISYVEETYGSAARAAGGAEKLVLRRDDAVAKGGEDRYQPPTDDEPAVHTPVDDPSSILARAEAIGLALDKAQTEALLRTSIGRPKDGDNEVVTQLLNSIERLENGETVVAVKRGPGRPRKPRPEEG